MAKTKTPKKSGANGAAAIGRNRVKDADRSIEPTSFRDAVTSMRELSYTSKIELVRLRCRIVGLPPGFLMHSRRGMAIALPGPAPTIKPPPPTPEEMAELAAYYVDPDARVKHLCLPWDCLRNAMVGAAFNYKISGNKTFMDTVASSVACEQDNIPLTLNDKPIRKYTLKRDWGSIPPGSHKMVPIGRALIPEWEANFELVVDPDYFGVDLVNFIGGVLKDAGKQKGVGVWSPRLKGPFGKFRVDEVKFVAKDNKGFLESLSAAG